MKRLLLALLLFSSPVLAEKYTIYTTERPPSSWSGIIDSEGYYYWFTNNKDAKCDIKSNGCWIKTNEKAEIINEDIIKAQGRYFCSEEHIQARKKADPKPVFRRGGGYMDYGYGICTKNGWVTKSLDDL